MSLGDTVRRDYETGGRWSSWSDFAYEEPDQYRVLINKIINSKFWPCKRNGEAVRLLSPSANVGFIEDLFPEDIYVFAGDISSQIQKRPAKLPAFQADAMHLPIGDNSLDVIFDYRGALLHTLRHDKNHDVKHTKELLASYRRVLVEGGIIIVDAGDEHSTFETYRTLVDSESLELGDMGLTVEYVFPGNSDKEELGFAILRIS